MKVEEQYKRLPRTDERIEGQTYFDAIGVRQAFGCFLCFRESMGERKVRT